MEKKTIPAFEIETYDDVRKFFSWLVSEAMLTHPDDSFTIFIDVANEVGEPACITKGQAYMLDGLMEKCFDVCDKEGVDIYELAMDETLVNYDC